MMGGALTGAGQAMGAAAMAAPPPPPAPGFAAPRWSLTVDGKTYGPYSDDAVSGMIAAGQVAPSTLGLAAGRGGLGAGFELRGARGRRAGPPRRRRLLRRRPADHDRHMSAVPTVASAAPAKLRKFPCAACGADVVWNPGAAALKCPYCGAERRDPEESRQRRRSSRSRSALKGATDLGWGMARKAVSCRGCGATTTFDAGVAASRCAFCGAPSVVEAPPSGTMVRPAGVLPFRIDRNGATAKFRQWLSSLWFRPDDLSQKSSLSELRGVYVPFWTFDAATHSAWTADAGYRLPGRGPGGGERPDRTRYETRTRWEPAEGVLEHFFDDLPVAASRGLPADLARAIEPFPTRRSPRRTSLRTSRGSSPRSTPWDRRRRSPQRRAA